MGSLNSSCRNCENTLGENEEVCSHCGISVTDDASSTSTERADSGDEVFANASLDYVQYIGGVDIYTDQEFTAEEISQLRDQLIKQYESALGLGLSGQDEIESYCRLGNLYFDKIIRRKENHISREGLDRDPFAAKSAMLYEQALYLDIQAGRQIFSNPKAQAAYLLNLSDLWNWHSFYVLQTEGTVEAANYLLEKVNLLADFDLYLPHLCSSLGFFAVDVNVEFAKHWLRTAIDAEDFDEERYQAHKNRAAAILSELTQ